jgi:hypothetical protein
MARGEALLRSLLADFIRRSPLRRANVTFATSADFVRRRSLRRPKAEREGFVSLLNRIDYQYLMWNLFLTHRNTHHFFNTD